MLVVFELYTHPYDKDMSVDSDHPPILAPGPLVTTDHGKPDIDTERTENLVLMPRESQAPESSPSGSHDLPIDLTGGNDAISESYRHDSNHDFDLQTSADERKAALLTLQPGCMLSSTALVLSWNYLKSNDDCVLDPLFFGEASVTRYISTDKPVIVRDRIFVPIHSCERNHWYLAVIQKQGYTIAIYDSIASNNTSMSNDSKLLVQLARKSVDEREDWGVSIAACPQQSNDKDCGIYILATICYLMAELELPKKYDGDAWRLVCRCLIQGFKEENAQAQLPALQDTSTSVNSISCSVRADRLDEVFSAVQKASRIAEQHIATTRTKQKDPQSSVALIRDTSSVLRSLHEHACRRSDLLVNQIQRDADALEKHLKFLNEYASLVSESCPLSETRNAFSAINTAHQSQMKEQSKSKASLEALEGNKARMEIAISMLQDIDAILCTGAKREEENDRLHLECWRKELDMASGKLGQLLAGDSALQ